MVAGKQKTGLVKEPDVLTSPVPPYSPYTATATACLYREPLTRCLSPFIWTLSFRQKIALHSNFHNTSRGLRKLSAVIYEFAPLGAAIREVSKEISHTTNWIRTSPTLIIIYLTLGKNPTVKQNNNKKKALKIKSVIPWSSPLRISQLRQIPRKQGFGILPNEKIQPKN